MQFVLLKNVKNLLFGFSEFGIITNGGFGVTFSRYEKNETLKPILYTAFATDIA